MSIAKITLGGDFKNANSLQITNGDIFDADINLTLDVSTDAAYPWFYIHHDINSNSNYLTVNGWLIEGITGGYLFDYSERLASVRLQGGSFGDVLRGGIGDDILGGESGNDVLLGGGNDVLEGGSGADMLTGGAGIDTASYEHATGGVYVRLDDNTGYDGDALGDQLSGIENLKGSIYQDSLIGDDNANTIVGNGGADDIDAKGGNDRIVISATPAYVSGGAGTDTLIIKGGGMVSGTSFEEIEAIYVREDATLDMSGAVSGARIVSQSTVGGTVNVTGTSGVDRIIAGKGNDTVHGGADNDLIKGGSGHASLLGDAGSDRIIAGSGGAVIDGGEGNDTLFGGAGADTISFSSNFGRDVVYKFSVGIDHLDLANLSVSFEDVNIRSVHGGRDTQITVDGIDATQTIFLRDVAAASLSSDDFMFGI